MVTLPEAKHGSQNWVIEFSPRNWRIEKQTHHFWIFLRVVLQNRHPLVCPYLCCLFPSWTSSPDLQGPKPSRWSACTACRLKATCLRCCASRSSGFVAAKAATKACRWRCRHWCPLFWWLRPSEMGGLPWKTPWKIHGKYWVIIRDIDAFDRMLKPEICSFLGGTPPFFCWRFQTWTEVLSLRPLFSPCKIQVPAG